MEPLPAPQALSALALVVALVPPLALGLWWHWRRRARAEARAEWAAARMRALEEALATAPDGWFAWLRGGVDPEDAGPETVLCSRRLAVLLALYAGRASTFDDVLTAIGGEDAETLRGLAATLRTTGEGFEVVVSLPGPPQSDGAPAPRHLRVTGQRALGDDGAVVADLLWLRDITAEEAPLRAREAATAVVAAERDRLRVMLDALPLPVWLRDSSLRPVLVNRAFQAASGSGPVGEGGELADGVAAREMRALASAARAAGQPRTSAFHVVLGGNRRLMEITEVPVSDDGAGGPGAGGRLTVGLAQDATRLEALRSTLEREAASHAEVLERLNTAIAIFGPDRALLFHNTAFARLWRLDDGWLRDGPSYGDVLETLRSRRLLPEVADWPAFRDAELGRFKTLLEPLEDLLHLPDGKTLRRVLAPHPLGGLMVMVEDVTDRLALEAARTTLVAVQRQTLDHLHEAVAVFGADGRLRLHNPTFARLWGLAEVVLSGEPSLAEVIEALPPEDRDTPVWDAMRALLAAPPQDRTVHSRRLEQEGTILDMVSVPLPDGGMLFTLLDMSDTARAEDALRQRAEVLAEADRMKSAFLANVSYELRTPLTTVMGFAEILADEYYGSLNARQKDYARSIAETAQSLVGLIDDLSDVASLESGGLTLDRAPVDVHALLAGVLAATRETVRRKGLTVNFDCPPDMPPLVADDRRLRQVLRHLMLSAIAHTDPASPDTPARGGQITLAAQPENDVIVFTVADTGRGLSEAEQALVRQGPGHTAPGAGGVGLALVRGLVEQHGGTVEVISVPGEGTTIHLRVPATP